MPFLVLCLKEEAFHRFLSFFLVSDCSWHFQFSDFPGDSDNKESAMPETQVRSLGGEDFPGEGHGNPLWYSNLGYIRQKYSQETHCHVVSLVVCNQSVFPPAFIILCFILYIMSRVFSCT